MRIGLLDVFDRGRAQRREGERDSRSPGGTCTGGLTFGLHQPGEAGGGNAEGHGRAAAHDLGRGVDVRDVFEDRRVELDITEGLNRTLHRDLALGCAVRVVERRGRGPALRDLPQVLDRQRVLQAAFLRVEFELLELHQLEDLGRLRNLPLDHVYRSFVRR